MNIHFQRVGLEQVFYPYIDNKEYPVTVDSDSTILGFKFNQTEKQLSLNVTGKTGTSGSCDITVPDGLLWGEFSLYKDGLPLEEDVDYTETHNGTHYIFCINYDLSTHAIDIQGTEVIPEFPALTSMLLMLTVLAVVIVAYKRRLLKTPIH